MIDEVRYVLDSKRWGLGAYWIAAGFTADVPAEMVDGAPHDSVIAVTYDTEREDWRIDSLTVTRGVHVDMHGVESEREVSTESLREMPVGRVLVTATRSIRHLVEDRNGVDFYDAMKAERALFAMRRTDGPTPENLADVATLYLVARLLRDSPARTISEAFDMPERTASHWIKLAQERDHLHV